MISIDINGQVEAGKLFTVVVQFPEGRGCKWITFYKRTKASAEREDLKNLCIFQEAQERCAQCNANNRMAEAIAQIQA